MHIFCVYSRDFVTAFEAPGLFRGFGWRLLLPLCLI